MKKFWNNLNRAMAYSESLVAMTAFLAVILFIFVLIPLIINYPIALLGTSGAAVLARIVYAGITGK